MRQAVLVGVVAAAMASMLGCSASLRDGVYGCADGQCPASLPNCWSSDHRCHAAAESDAGPQVDTGMLPPVDGGNGGACAPTMLGSCGAGQSCVVGAWSGPGPSYQCASATQIVSPSHGNPCVMGGSPGCSVPDACIPGSGGSRCMRPCGPPDPCGFTEDCAMTSTGNRVCAAPCGAGGICPAFGFRCSAGHCLPVGW